MGDLSTRKQHNESLWETHGSAYCETGWEGLAPESGPIEKVAAGMWGEIQRPRRHGFSACLLCDLG